MKKVLIYRSSLLQKSETFILNQSKEFINYEYEFLCTKRNFDGIDLSNYAVNVVNLKNKSIFHKLYRMLENIFLIENIDFTKKIAEINPDIVHAHFGVDALRIFPSIKKMNIPMVVTLHGYDVMTNAVEWRSGRMGLSNINYINNILKMAKYSKIKFICVSKALQVEAIRLGIPKEKTTVVYTGVEVDDNLIIEKNKLTKDILFVGRLVEKKGVPVLLRACKILNKSNINYNLNIIGTGPDIDDIKNIASNLGVNVCFLGEMKFSDVDFFMRRASVFCLPSIKSRNGDAEGFGMVLLEAQARGVPVVSSALGGAKEGIIDKITGYSFPEGDHETLAKYLKIILLDREGSFKMGEAAFNFVKNNFDVKKCSQNVEKIYSEMI